MGTSPSYLFSPFYVLSYPCCASSCGSFSYDVYHGRLNHSMSRSKLSAIDSCDASLWNGPFPYHHGASPENVTLTVFSLWIQILSVNAASQGSLNANATCIDAHLSPYVCHDRHPLCHICRGRQNGLGGRDDTYPGLDFYSSHVGIVLVPYSPCCCCVNPNDGQCYIVNE